MLEESFDQRLRVGIFGKGVRRRGLVCQESVDDLAGLGIPLLLHEFFDQVFLEGLRFGRIGVEDASQIVVSGGGGLKDHLGVGEVFDGGVAEAQPRDVIVAQDGAGKFCGVDLTSEQIGGFEVVSGRGVEVGDFETGFVDACRIVDASCQFEIIPQPVEGRVELIGEIGVCQQRLHVVQPVEVVRFSVEQVLKFLNPILFQINVALLSFDDSIESKQFGPDLFGLMGPCLKWKSQSEGEEQKERSHGGGF